MLRTFMLRRSCGDGAGLTKKLAHTDMRTCWDGVLMHEDRDAHVGFSKLRREHAGGHFPRFFACVCESGEMIADLLGAACTKFKFLMRDEMIADLLSVTWAFCEAETLQRKDCRCFEGNEGLSSCRPRMAKRLQIF